MILTGRRPTCKYEDKRRGAQCKDISMHTRSLIRSYEVRQPHKDRQYLYCGIFDPSMIRGVAPSGLRGQRLIFCLAQRERKEGKIQGS